jgi:signal transduction histidine kinase/DNA-binding NarL/FixJ family response regulator
LDKSGAVWVATDQEGLFCLLPENRDSLQFINYRHKPESEGSISSNTVFSVYCSYNGTLWAGTNNGLNRFDPETGTFEYFNIKNGFNAYFVFCVRTDGSGNVWASTEKGLTRFNPDAEEGKRFKLFSTSDGLPFDKIYPYHFDKGKDGRFYMGGERGFGLGYFSFHPDSIKDNTLIPPVVITGFKVKNNDIPLDTAISYKKQLHLQYDQNFIAFEFASLDYNDPGKNEYYYKLEGMDDDWIYSGNRRFANYTGLSPGSYVFRVKGSNNDGYWNEAGASLAITIAAPPWKTWWAYLLYGLFIFTVLYLIFRYYLKRQQLLHKLALEHVQTEKLEELDRMKSRFFANISHEFRTPLTLILGPIEKLKSYIKDKEPKEDLNMMHRNARRLQNLINQLLSLSKLESGKMKLQSQEVNIISLVNRYVQSFESLAKQKKIEFKFNSSETKIPLFVDKDKIEKILYNLLSNAFKFTEEGGRIEVSVTPINPPSRGDKAESKISPLEGGRGVNITISDTGRGIPQEKLPHVFDRFYQVDDNYTKDQEGSGIGLALTKELVEIHHGIITVESQLEKGTTFTVLLPLGKEHLKTEEIVVHKDSFGEPASAEASADKSVDREDPPEQIAELQAHETPIDDYAEKEDTKPLLLIIEDNDDLRSYIRSYLTDDYQISEAIDGEMGLQKAIEKIPNLVISDVMMPKMDGMELCRRLKTDERTCHIPVILLTAKAAMEDKLEGLETGADDFLTKPFDPQELVIRIRNLIQQRRKLQKIFARNISSIGQLTDSSISSMDKKFMKKSVEVVEENLLDADFNVEQLGQEMNMSRMQLHRKLRALVDQSAGEFIRTIRLNRAAILLKEKTANIAEIAYDVGFNNPSYFSECFRKQFGKLPSEYSD